MLVEAQPQLRKGLKVAPFRQDEGVTRSTWMTPFGSRADKTRGGPDGSYRRIAAVDGLSYARGIPTDFYLFRSVVK
jgi:hypothetical protein